MNRIIMGMILAALGQFNGGYGMEKSPAPLAMKHDKEGNEKMLLKLRELATKRHKERLLRRYSKPEIGTIHEDSIDDDTQASNIKKTDKEVITMQERKPARRQCCCLLHCCELVKKLARYLTSMRTDEE